MRGIKGTPKLRGNRAYMWNPIIKKRELVSWSQATCKLCHKFLSKKNDREMYCSKCAKKVHYQVQNASRKSVRETLKKIINFSIPRVVWRELDYGVL